MNQFALKFKEVVYAVLPVTVIILLMNFTLVPLDAQSIIKFLIGAVLIVIGLTFFLSGVDIGIGPVGSHMGTAIVKTNKLLIVVLAGLILGFFISIAEPDLHILAGQVDYATSGSISRVMIVVSVSVGIAVMISAGLIRIVYGVPLYILLMVLYGIILVISLFTSQEFLAIAFDASGATTGALTVPFILALALGISSLKKDSKASEKDSFGLVAIASTGPIISVMVMSIFMKTHGITRVFEPYAQKPASIFMQFIHKIPSISLEVFLALLPILTVFLVFQPITFKLSKRQFNKTLIGFIFTYVGILLYFVGVNVGFMEVGRIAGSTIASLDNKAWLVAVGFILGFVTILAEPAVNVLTHQIEDVTSGYVNRKVVLFALSIGVGLAVAFSMLRILIPELKLWHFLLPGYLISIGMTLFVPKIFVGIAFDSGGVASGPMTATYILAFTQGAAGAVETADIIVDGLGMIAMVALMPIIALQVLGFIYKIKSRKRGIEESVT